MFPTVFLYFPLYFIFFSSLCYYNLAWLEYVLKKLFTFFQKSQVRDILSKSFFKIAFFCPHTKDTLDHNIGHDSFSSKLYKLLKKKTKQKTSKLLVFTVAKAKKLKYQSEFLDNFHFLRVCRLLFLPLK